MLSRKALSRTGPETQDFDSCGSVGPKGPTEFWSRKADRPSDRPYREPVPDIISGLLGDGRGGYATWSAVDQPLSREIARSG